MASIVINGKSITVTGGCSVQIVNGTVTINGRDMTPDGKEIRIEVHGDVERLDVDACNQIRVNGAVSKLSTVSGSVSCGVVGGSVKTTSGAVRCEAITGSVETVSGAVEASHIGGSVRTVTGRIR